MEIDKIKIWCTFHVSTNNTKLHSDAPLNPPNLVDKPSSLSQDQSVVTYVEQDKKSNVTKQIILATALVIIENAVGHQVQCRAILDSGSQVYLITRECASILKINASNSLLSIAGIRPITAKTDTMITTTMCSRINDFKAVINFHVINSITNRLPSHCINIEPLNIPHTISNCLTDPHFSEPASVDILLGAEIFFELFTGDKMKISPLITLHNTSLGWIVTGSIQINTILSPPTSLFSSNCNQSAIALLTQSCSNKFSSEIKAEHHFKCNVSRDDLGQFVVKLPFVQDPSVLDDSRFMAQQRFYNLERKLSKNPTLAADNKTFMNEYLELGHMEKSPADPLKDYRLLTVTYGTRAASFLDTRCLLQLSYSVTNHATQRAIQQDFYVNDLLSGGGDETECYELFQDLSNELNKANLPLRK
ncbi:hypothetical protein QTP88_024566 [Uroleucon formosanum]